MVKNNQTGFTLVELLTVVAIIAVLASLLFGVLASAKAEAKRTVCGSNLRQIYLGLDLYAQDNGGWDQPIPSLIVTRPYIADAEIFRCPVETTITPDPAGLYPLRLLNLNDPYTSPVRISYAFVGDYATANEPQIWRNLVADSRIGVVACPWHGPLNPTLQSAAAKYLQNHTGPIERVCFDGHLIRRPRGDQYTTTTDLFYAPATWAEIMGVTPGGSQ